MTAFPNYDFPLNFPAALIVIDMQPSCVSADVGLGRSLESTSPGYTNFLVERVQESVVPALRSLADAFHEAAQPIFYTSFASITGDGSDIRTSTIRYRNEQRLRRTGSSAVIARSEAITDIVNELPLDPSDIVLTKTSMDTFLTTDIQLRLETANVQSVVVAGVYSDACVESTARTAAELGFRVFVAEDACAAWEPGFHDKSMSGLARYFAVVESSADLIVRISCARTNT